MKTIINIIIRFTEILFTLEFLAIPGGFWLNTKEPNVINLREFILYDIFAMIGTIILGIIMNELNKPKNENKTKR